MQQGADREARAALMDASRRTRRFAQQFVVLVHELEDRNKEIEVLRREVDDPTAARQYVEARNAGEALRDENSLLRRELRLASESARKASEAAQAEVGRLQRELKLAHLALKSSAARHEEPLAACHAPAQREPAEGPRSDNATARAAKGSLGAPVEPGDALACGTAPDDAAGGSLGDGARPAEQAAAAPAQDGGAPMQGAVDGTEDENLLPEKEPAPERAPAELLGLQDRAAGKQPHAAAAPLRSTTLAANHVKAFGKRQRTEPARTRALGHDDLTSDLSAELQRARQLRDEQMVAKGYKACLGLVVKTVGAIKEAEDDDGTSWTSKH